MLRQRTAAAAFAATAALVFCGSAKADPFYLIGGNSTGADFIALNSIKSASPDRWRFWDLLVYPKVLKVGAYGIDYTMAENIIDCSADTIQTIYTAHYTLSGSELAKGEPTNQTPQPIIPGSQATHIEDAVCKGSTRDKAGIIDAPIADLVAHLRSMPAVYFPGL